MPIRTVAIVAKPGAPTAAGIAREVQRYLQQRGAAVLFESYIGSELGEVEYAITREQWLAGAQ